MKKIISKLKNSSLFMFVLGITLCSGIVYGANLYKSEDIQYTPTDSSWEVSNVSTAINSLYSMKNELDNIKGLGDATPSDIISGKTAVVNGELITGSLNATSTVEKITHLTYSNGYQSTTPSISSSTSYTFTKDYDSVQISSFIAAGNGASDTSGNSVTVQLNGGTASSATRVSNSQTYTFLSSSYAIRVFHAAYTYSLSNIKAGDVVKINYSISYPSGGTQAHFDSILYGI